MSAAGALSSRGVLALRGKGLFPFLQKLISNDVHEVERTGSPLLYAAALSPQGRFLHDMFLQRTSDAEPTLLADVDQHSKHELIKHLEAHCLHHQVDIADVSDTHSVMVRFGQDAPSGAGVGWRRDPRLPALGQRAIVRNSEVEGLGAGSADPALWHAYRRWRALHGVCEGAAEIPSGTSIPQEYNLDALNAISFSKGCYVGQEFVSRVHARGVVRKRLMPFRLEGPLKMDPGAEMPLSPIGEPAPCIFDEFDTEHSLASVGQARVIEGDVGLGVVRLHTALMAVREGDPLFIGTIHRNQPMRLVVPDWWPDSFFEHVGVEDHDTADAVRA